MSDYRVVAIKGQSCGCTSYRTEQEAREAAAILCVSSDRVLIKLERSGRTIWDEGAGIADEQ